MIIKKQVADINGIKSVKEVVTSNGKQSVSVKAVASGEKSQSTKQKIISESMILFQKNGYEETTIKEICAACRISKGTFYYHFQTKSDIIYGYYEPGALGLEELAPKLLLFDTPREQLWEITRLSIEYSNVVSPKVLRGFYRADMERGMDFFNPFAYTQEKHKQRRELEKSLIEKGQKMGCIRRGDPNEMLFAYYSAQYGIAITWAFNDGKVDEVAAMKRVFEGIF